MENTQIKDGGFTILELLVVVFILAVLGSSAVSMTTSTLDSADKSTAEVQIVQNIRRAQATSVTEGCRGIITIASNSANYSFGCDYLPYNTANPPVPDVTFFYGSLPQGITMAASGTIIFNSRGQSVDIDSVLTTRTITLTSTQGVSTSVFATGTLRATGFFSYN